VVDHDGVADGGEGGVDDGEFDGVDDLGEFDSLMVELKASGLSDPEAALQLGCSSKTVWRRRKNPAVVTALAARKEDRVAQAAALLGEAVIEAVATMREGLVAPKHADRQRAAGQLVNAFLRLRGEADTDTAIAQLRADVADLKRTLKGVGQDGSQGPAPR
jgi:hypothetical protein